MNIPVILKPGTTHPSLNELVFKGAEFTMQSELFNRIQRIIQDPTLNILDTLGDLEHQFQLFENDIIERTKSNITPEEQMSGKLIQRTTSDADRLNNLSSQYFTLLQHICREANLSANVPIVQASSMATKRQQVADEKIMPGISSYAISKQLDQAIKRCRTVHQRSIMLCHAIVKLLKQVNPSRSIKQHQHLHKCIKRLLKQQENFSEDVYSLINTCQEVAEDRNNHIIAVETARGKKFLISIVNF